MAKFLVDYYETYSKSYEVEANSKEEAEEIIKEDIAEGRRESPYNCTDSWYEVEKLMRENKVLKVKYVGIGGMGMDYKCYEDKEGNIFFKEYYRDIFYTGAYRNKYDDICDEPNERVKGKVAIVEEFRHNRGIIME